MINKRLFANQNQEFINHGEYQLELMAPNGRSSVVPSVAVHVITSENTSLSDYVLKVFKKLDKYCGFYHYFFLNVKWG